jgi:hypothetical protein
MDYTFHLVGSNGLCTWKKIFDLCDNNIYHAHNNQAHMLIAHVHKLLTHSHRVDAS